MFLFYSYFLFLLPFTRHIGGNVAVKFPYMCGRRKGRKRSNFIDPGDILAWPAAKKMNRKEVIEMSGHKVKRSPGPRDSYIIPGKNEMTDCTRV